MRVFVTSLVLIFSIIGWSCVLQTENYWIKLAEADLDYVRKIIEKNHPGYVDPTNPEFKKKLHQSFKNAKSQFKYIGSLNGLMNVLNEFTASFADGHVGLNFNYVTTNKAWAGIRVERRRATYVVTKIANDWPAALPVLGSQLLSCDGEDVEYLMENSILRYRYANYKENYPREYYASKLFIDDGAGYRSRPSRCIFSLESGENYELALEWQYFDSLSFEWDTTVSKQAQFSFEMVHQSLAWIQLPTFTPNEKQIMELDAINNLINAKTFAASDTVVFDLRGNKGGNSYHGFKLLFDLYGEIATRLIWEAEQSKYENQERPLWRVSKDNHEYIQSKLGPSENSSSDEFFRQLNEDMKKAIENDIAFTSQPSINLVEVNEDISNVDLESVIETLPHVILITDRFCASACLNFIDVALRFPKVTHVGRETFADTQYNEVRHVTLPSNLGEFYFPMAVSLPKGPFKPQYIFDGDMTNSQGLRKWIVENLKNFN